MASVERRVAFRVRGDPALLVERSDSLWRAASHALGRGRMRPDQILVAGEGFRLRMLAGSCDGAEIRTAVPFSYGEYSVRMRTPFAPGSLSAFFQYGSGAGDRNDEIDIEIFNDGSRRALLTAWTRGTKSRESSVTLPFDPAGDAHDYTIRWTARSLEFWADGRRLARWAGNYPHSPMRLMVSVWWPQWLSCEPTSEDKWLRIDSMRLAPTSPTR